MPTLKKRAALKDAILGFRKSNQCLESIIAASHDGILVVDGTGRLEFANPSSHVFLGRSEGQLIGSPLTTVIPPESHSSFVRFWDAVVAGQPSQLTLEITGLDGIARIVLVGQRRLQVDGAPKYFLGLRDVTTRVRMERELRQERDRVQRYLQIAGVMIVAIDRTQKVVMANRRACEILGYPEDGILQQNWFDTFVPTRERARVREAFDELIRGEISVVEYFENPVLIHSGEERLIAWHNKLVYDDDGRIVGTLSSGTDITDRKKAERELLLLNETLEQRVIERTAVAEAQAKSLRALTRQLVQAESQERRRIALILHEHYQQLLAAARFDLSRAMRQFTDDELHELLRGVDGILREAIESSRSLAVELCPPVLHELGLVPALEWLGKRMHERHDLEVLVDAGPHAELEDLDLRTLYFEAVRELLFNVVKHAQTRAARVTLWAEDGLLRIRVADEGVGFDPKVVPDQRADTPVFGLFVIRERLTTFGGSMDLETAPGAGTRVTLSAPLRPATD